MKYITHSRIILFEIAFADFLLAFAVLMLSRYFLPGYFPRWFYLAASAFLWALLGAVAHKLEFWYFSSRKTAMWTITVVDCVVYLLFFISWKLIFPDRGIETAQLTPLPLLLLIELALYNSWYYLFRKQPYLYIENIERPYFERGIEKAPKYLNNEEKNRDLVTIYEATKSLKEGEGRKWILDNISSFSPDTLVVMNGSVEELKECKGTPNLIICLKPFNNIRHFNSFLATASEMLPMGGTIMLYGETSGMRRHRIASAYPDALGNMAAIFDYVWSRVISKLSFTRRVYMLVTGGRNRNFPRVEVLGRIAKAGFDICGDEMGEDAFLVAAVKRREPIKGGGRYGLFVRLPRTGKNGKRIGVFKLRTMYAYSEYIQDYTYKLNGLEHGGKLKDDFRVNIVGTFCRSRFLDELPMFINFFKGDLKLVGVRPLSKHYLSLYTPDMQAMHLSVKPGIFPPLYYEYPKPDTLEEIMESERRYIEQYNQHRFKTDWTYFWGMMRNILIRRERSH